MCRRVVFAAVLACAPLSSLAAAPPPQTTQSAVSAATLRGTIVDATRSPIAGATVTAVPEGGGAPLSVRSDSRGAFELRLPAGSYTIRLDAAGFEPEVQKVRTAQIGTNVREYTLAVAGLRDSVTVVAPGGYQEPAIRTATKTPTPLVDVPQSVTVVSNALIRDQLMASLADVVQYVPGAAAHQGENNRDEVILRGNNSSANFFVDGVRDDVQYYRDLYNTRRVEVIKGPNALIFGRGGAGGVVNRVQKEAESATFREVLVEGGSYDTRRISTDVNAPLSSSMAVRLNGVFEDSDSFRSNVGLRRYGVSPSFSFTPSPKTRLSVSYEYFYDDRTADRGITSFQGRPVDVDPSTYFGDPSQSDVWARVNLTKATIEHRIGGLTIRNHTLFGAYDRKYQNFVPGAVTPDGLRFAMTSYNNATQRNNLFNQTDFVYAATTGALRHTLLAGVEAGRQVSDNFRNTGFFNNATTSIVVPLDQPTISVPVTFRQNATDADNRVRARVGAAYVQDQVALSHAVQMIGGLRVDRFGMNYHDNRSGVTLERPDTLLSPRAGVVYKPAIRASLYGSYSVSYLPSSGDQFSSLTVITDQLKPEKFTNYEVGAKWDLAPGLSLTTDTYRLDRTNTRSTDPNDPTRIVQTGSQRTNGYELGVNGQVNRAWAVAGGYALQSAHVTSATAAAPLGKTVGQVPRHTLSLWNRYQFAPKLAAGVGVIYRSDMFATIDNTVTLPGYVRFDAAAYYTLTRALRLQVNAQNLLDRKYFLNSDSNTNISPGSPRAVRVALTTMF
jgi:catecholate siderophore receptor